jgi:formylglycine-generating enzyme required for sulfatase activity
MAWVSGGEFLMGSSHFYAEEAPVHRVRVDGFWMDVHAVTNAEFTRFVTATGHITTAEKAPNAADYPGADPALLVPGSAVFQQPSHPVGLDDPTRWWAYIPGANWRRPLGVESDLDGKASHPVVHVSYEDAAAYAAWAGKDLPTEAEWERAARGGLDDAIYAWGNERTPGGKVMANTWYGEFPWQNLRPHGFVGTAPVDAFDANPFGLKQMTGNVWEWTRDWFREHHPDAATKACCLPQNPHGAQESESYDRRMPVRIPRKVIKGGSYLCAPNYCLRYRPAARSPETIESSTCHLGFRCVIRAGTPA